MRLRAWSTRRTVRIAVAIAVQTLVMSLLAEAPANAWYSLPGGRPSFVVSAMAGPINAVSVRVAEYQFRKDGTVTQEYWGWRQNSISGKDQGYWTKPSSGYKTQGCRYTCSIRTPYGFQSGKDGTFRTGRFYVSPRNVLVITWSPTWVEKWRVNNSASGVTGLKLISSDASARGWGIGGRAALSTAVGMKAIYDAKRFYGPYASNAYGVPTKYTNVGFSYNDYQLCSNGLCLQGKGLTDPDKRKWYSSYFAANPAKDGRKVFRNHQTGVVQQMESPGSVCISGGGGHTEALLQALDDSGRIVGLVGVEASLSQQKTGQAVVTAFAMVQPAIASALG